MAIPMSPRALMGLLVAAAAPQLASAATAKQCGAGICLTSFAWCDENTCTYPDEGCYPRQLASQEWLPPATFAYLMDYITYNLTWEFDSGEQSDSPTLVQWLINDIPQWERTIPAGQLHMAFRPEDVFAEFPTELAPNVNASEIRAWAAYDSTGRFEVTQPSYELAEDAAHPNPWVVSGNFAVQPVFYEEVYSVQATIGANQMYDKWELGVGVGVGVGVPLLMAATAAAAWVMGKKKGASSVTAHVKE